MMTVDELTEVLSEALYREPCAPYEQREGVLSVEGLINLRRLAQAIADRMETEGA